MNIPTRDTTLLQMLQLLRVTDVEMGATCSDILGTGDGTRNTDGNGNEDNYRSVRRNRKTLDNESFL